MAYFLDNYPVSENCGSLELTEEQEKNCRVVYKLDDEGGAYFSGLWDPDVEYSDEYVIVPLRSTGGKVNTIRWKTNFANVIGSKDDPKPPGQTSWISYWKSLTGESGSSCSTDGKFYYMNGAYEMSYANIFYPEEIAGQHVDETTVTAKCSETIVGGHTIINTKAATPVPPGGKVYIIPICDKHNLCHTTIFNNWGTGFYMKLKNHTKAIELQGYLSNVKDYIDKLKEEDNHE